MKVGSLFAGIGGFDLGLERAGFEIAWQVEIDEFCRKVLTKHWPGVTRYEDIKAFNWALDEARRCGLCFCGEDVSRGQESCTDCAVIRYLTPELMGNIPAAQCSDAIAEAIWRGESLLSWRKESEGRSAEQARKGDPERQDITAERVREMWRDAAAVQGWAHSDTSPPSRLQQAVGCALALPAVPPLGASACLERILVNPSGVKVNLISGGFP